MGKSPSRKFSEKAFVRTSVYAAAMMSASAMRIQAQMPVPQPRSNPHFPVLSIRGFHRVARFHSHALDGFVTKITWQRPRLRAAQAARAMRVSCADCTNSRMPRSRLGRPLDVQQRIRDFERKPMGENHTLRFIQLHPAHFNVAPAEKTGIP